MDNDLTPTRRDPFPDQLLHYKLQLSKLEVKLLGDFLRYVVRKCYRTELQIHRNVAYGFRRRYLAKWDEPQKGMVKMSIAEALAIVQLLYEADYPVQSETGQVLNHLITKIHQQLPVESEAH